MNRLIKLLLFIYVLLIRPFFSRLLYMCFRPFVTVELYRWNLVKNLFLEDFSKEISRIQYHFDPLRGALDFTIYDPNIYFDTVGSDSSWLGRDCDDAAYMWKLYARHHKLEYKTIAVINGFSIRKLHFFVVVKHQDKYRYANYEISREKYDNYTDAINAVCKLMKYNNPIYIKF